MEEYKDRLRKKDYFVKEIELSDARAFIEKYHYAKGSSKTRVYCHGLFKKEDPTKLLGVTIWLPPTRVAAESVNKMNWTKVLSLSRLAIHPDVPKNACSFLLSQSVKIIKKDGRFVSLVTYADERQNHTGTIYKSCNWNYIGKMSGKPTWIDPLTKRQVSAKSTKNRTKQQMLDLGYVNIGIYPKHKYVLHIGDVT